MAAGIMRRLSSLIPVHNLSRNCYLPAQLQHIDSPSSPAPLAFCPTLSTYSLGSWKESKSNTRSTSALIVPRHVVVGAQQDPRGFCMGTQDALHGGLASAQGSAAWYASTCEKQEEFM